MKLHASEDGYKFLDKGWLAAMSDPDIRTLTWDKIYLDRDRAS